MSSLEARRTYASFITVRTHFACGPIVTTFLTNGRLDFAFISGPLWQTTTFQGRQLITVDGFQCVHITDSLIPTISRAPILFAIFALIVLRTRTFLFVIVDEFACAAITFQRASVWNTGFGFACDAQFVVAHYDHIIGTFTHSATGIAGRQQTNAVHVTRVQLTWVRNWKKENGRL